MVELLRYKEVMLLPALLAFLAVGGKRPLWAKWLGAQLIAATIIEFIGILTRASGIANHGMYNLYMVIEFATLWEMIGTASARDDALLRWCRVGSIATALVWILDLSQKGTLHEVSTNTLIISGALLATAAAFASFLYMRSTFTPLRREPLFWALLSVVAYFMCFVPVFGLYNHYRIRNLELATVLLELNDWLFLLRYSLVCVSMVLLVRQVKNKHA